MYKTCNIHVTSFSIKKMIHNLCNYIVLSSNEQFMKTYILTVYIAPSLATIDFYKIPRRQETKMFCKNTQVLYQIFALMQYLYYIRDIFFNKLAICRQTRASCKPRFMETVSGDVPWTSPFDLSFTPFFPARYPRRERATHWSATNVQLSAIKSGLFARLRPTFSR